MPEKKKKINFAFRVSEERQEELKIVSARRKQSVQRMLELGLDLLLSAESSAMPAHELAAKDVRWHQMLSDILESGDEEAIKAVKQNLLVFHRVRKTDAAAALSLEPEEARIIEEFRKSSLQKRQQMLGFIAKPEALGPEVMPSRKRAGGKS